MKRRLNFLVAVALLACTEARASVTITFEAGSLYNAAGVAVPDGTLFALVADTGKNGFGSLLAGDLSLGSFVNADDQILGRGFVEGGFGTGSTAAIALQNGAFAQLDVNDPLAVLWFPGLGTASYSLSSGASYGLYTTSAPATGAAWLIPVDGTVSLEAFNLVNDTGALSGRASLSAIPEPSTYAAIVGVGALGFAAWRRRRAQRTSRRRFPRT